MEPRDAIQAQLEVLRQELHRSRAAVGSAELDGKLRDRVGARFDKLLTSLDSETAALTKKATSTTAGQSLEACWVELRQVQARADRVFGECLALLEGSLARKAVLDDGICELSDELLDDLAFWSDVRWDRFTLLATSEFYRDTAEIIRIRYPDLSLWSIPLAAHEFGHYVGPELSLRDESGTMYPFRELLKEADQARGPLLHSQQWHFLQEYFADVWATYTLGPAYAAAFILLRMNPSAASESGLTHPSGSGRVHGIFWVLDKMDQQNATPLVPPFRDLIDLLRELWHESLRQAGQKAALADAEAALVTQRMARLLELLVGATPERLAFTGADWLRAQGLAAELTPATLPDNLTRRDVLNAAWLARLQGQGNPRQVNDIAREARAVYRRIPPRRPRTPAPAGA